MKRDVRFPSGSETLAGDLYAPPSGATPRGTLVLFHGLASDRREFADAPEKLAARGFTVLAFDRRGHGQSSGEHGRLSRVWAVEDLRAALAFLGTASEAKGPIGLVGHSMGSALGVAALGEIAEFKAAALVAPVNRTDNEIGKAEMQGYKLANAMSRAKSRLTGKALVVPYKNNYPDLFRDKEAAKRAAAIGFLHRTISLANYDELMSVDASEWARKVTTPTLVVIAEFDKAVQHGSSRKVFENLAGPKKLEMLAGSGHSAFGDVKQKELLDLLDAWFAKHLTL